MSETHRCQALLLTPSGRDFAVAKSLLEAVDIESMACTDVRQLAEKLGDDVCCAIVADEALNGVDVAALTSWVSLQPPWSDLAFVILIRRSGGADHRLMAARLTKA